MKRRFGSLTVLGIVILLVGCGNSAKVIEGEVETTVSGVVEEADEQTEIIEEQENGDTNTLVHDGYVFVYNDVTLEIDAEADPVIEKLGEANSYFEAPSCAFNGIDKIYTYNSFEIDTYPSDDKDYISAIIFKDDAVITQEGIAVGDSVSKLKEVYGEADSEDSGTMIYEKGEMKLCFIIKDDVIASVEYRTRVLDE